MDTLNMSNTWVRGLYMLLFAIFFNIAEIVLAVVALFQFVVKLFSGSPNDRVKVFGQSLSTYIYQLMQFLTFNSDNRPFPFDAWPPGCPNDAMSAAGAVPPAHES